MENTDQSKYLAKEFLDEEYRRAWAEDYLNTTLAQQIAALRRARNWKQSDLAAKSGTTQSAVSRMEDVEYGAHSIRVLKQFAAAFGLRLKVSFEEFGTLIEESAAFTEESLDRNSFHQDAIIAKLLAAQGLTLPAAPPTPGTGTEDLAPVEAVTSRAPLTFEEQFEKLLTGPLLDRVKLLRKWLMGYGVPHPEAPPYKTLYFALPTDYRHGEWSASLAEACAELLLPESFAELQSDPHDGKDALTNLLRLSAMLPAGQKHIVRACSLLFPWLQDEWKTLPSSVQQSVIDLAVELADVDLTAMLLNWPERAELSSRDTVALCDPFLGSEMTPLFKQAMASNFHTVARSSEKGKDPSIVALSERVITEFSPPEIAHNDLQKRPNEKLAIAHSLLLGQLNSDVLRLPG